MCCTMLIQRLFRSHDQATSGRTDASVLHAGCGNSLLPEAMWHSQLQVAVLSSLGASSRSCASSAEAFEGTTMATRM